VANLKQAEAARAQKQAEFIRAVVSVEQMRVLHTELEALPKAAG
jgi:hypothetical protein